MVSTELTAPIESCPMRKSHMTIGLGLALSLLSAPMLAGGHIAIIDQYYAALQSADAGALAPLMAPKAEIILEDLDIIQTRDEFLASMDDWKVAIEGGELRHAITKRSDGIITVEVCYDFTDNNILVQERFTLNGGLITRQTQTQLDDDC